MTPWKAFVLGAVVAWMAWLVTAVGSVHQAQAQAGPGYQVQADTQAIVAALRALVREEERQTEALRDLARATRDCRRP